MSVYSFFDSKAIERLNEAVGEIERVARTDPALAGEGAVLLLEKLSPAVNQIDSSSGALSRTLNPQLAGEPAPARVSCDLTVQNVAM